MISLITSTDFWSSAINIVLAAHGLAILIVNSTDTPKDNEVVATLYRYVEWLAGIINPNKAKQ